MHVDQTRAARVQAQYSTSMTQCRLRNHGRPHRAHQPSSRIRRTPVATAARSVDETSAMRSRRRSFATARIWSVTATTSRSAQLTGTSRGGVGCAEVGEWDYNYRAAAIIDDVGREDQAWPRLANLRPHAGIQPHRPDFTAPGHCSRALLCRWIWRRIPAQWREYPGSD